MGNLLVILFTGIFSYRGFTNPRFEQKYIFRPQSILASREYYRLITSAFLHANWRHLLFNMISLYFFGSRIEAVAGIPHFLMIYFGAILGGSLLSLLIHRHHDYQAYGASGGVCGIIFASIFLFPGGGIMIFPLPFYVPAWLYAICFMLGEFYGMKAQRDNIGHDAHLGGAIFGLLIATALYPSIVSESPTLFATVLFLSLLLFLYLVKSPLFLPTRLLPGSPFRKESKRQNLPSYKQEELRMNELLERISQNGIHSLTAEEQAFLKDVSRKLQSRSESRAPKSGLPF